MGIETFSQNSYNQKLYSALSANKKYNFDLTWDLTAKAVTQRDSNFSNTLKQLLLYHNFNLNCPCISDTLFPVNMSLL